MGIDMPETDSNSVAKAIQELDEPSFETFLHTHVKNEHGREEDFQEQAKQFKQHFADAVKEAIEAGRLPRSVRSACRTTGTDEYVGATPPHSC